MEGYAPLDKLVKPLHDQRLRDRLAQLIDTFADQPQRSVPFATGNRNDMDAAYNFFKNRRICPAAIVAACLADLAVEVQDCRRVLAIQDTTDLNYSSLLDTTGLGYTDGSATLGLKLHSTLLVREDGLPLGLLTQQLWMRDPKQKGRTKDRRSRDAKDKESFRWQDHAEATYQALRERLLAGMTLISISDREGDIYQRLAAKRPANAHAMTRIAQPHRLVVSGPDGVQGALSSVVRAAAVLGIHTIEVPRSDDKPSRQAVLTVRVAAVKVLPPRHAKQRSVLGPVAAWAIEAFEESPPAGSQAICWRLLTTERIETWEEGLRALREYVLRWLIERFHFVLKSGCEIEQLQLSDADRLANAVAVYSQVAVRVMKLTYQLRVEPEASAAVGFSQQEIAVLQQSEGQRAKRPGKAIRTIADAVAAVARLGGHLSRKGDGPPGLKVLWRGLQCLHDRLIGYRLAHQSFFTTQPDTPSLTGDTRNE